MRNSVISYLENSVIRYPNKIAVKDKINTISFFQLRKKSQQIASRIISKELYKHPVGVYLPKGCLAVEAFCGISYSGNFYVPIDTQSPSNRLLSILSVLETELIITDNSHLAALQSFYSGDILIVDDISNDLIIDEKGLKRTSEKIIDTDAVYTIFTSGSTGTPKGVVISHRGVLDYIDWALETFRFDNSLVIGNQAPFYFDNSTLDIYLMLSTGATLVIVPDDYFSFPAKLVAFLNQEKINFIFWVPFVLITVANRNILEMIKPEYLRYVFFAGEVMPTKHLNYWRKYLPTCNYVNLYGPTEITVDCTYYVVERSFYDNEALPIGYPCRNTDVIIIKEDGTKAHVGEQGEMCIRGTSLALGYYNDWAKTQKTFIQNPFNKYYPETLYCTGDLVYINGLGEIMYVGRKDSQIKHNGYRIELGEIESALLESDFVKNVCASYDYVRKEICLFYECNEEVKPVDFVRALINSIPRYMIPTKYYRVDVIKQNPNGKIDRLYYMNKVNGKN